jgi:hypothetical protein
MKTPKEEKLAFVAYGRHPVMPSEITQRPNKHAPRYDFVEILMFAAGVLFVVAIAFVF